MGLHLVSGVFAIFFMFASPWLAARADSGEAVDWYGTIRFSKHILERTNVSIPEGQPLGPGTELNSKEVTWSGTARYLPGRKQVVTATYRREQIMDRRTDKSVTCPWKDGKTAYHDYELREAVSTVSVNKQWDSSHLNFRIREDGSYRTRAAASGGNHVPNSVRFHTRREFYSECSKPHLDVNDQVAYSSDGMESLDFEHIEGLAQGNAQTLSGQWSGKDDDGGDLTYSWELTRSEPVLVARIRATPAPLQRADTVTLSAAESTGPIARYEWEFTPSGENCLFTAEGSAVHLTGPTVSFVALCDFTAQLKVSSDQASDSTSLLIAVAARQGDAWTTKFKTAVGPGFKAGIFADQVHFGMNRCTQHAAGSVSDSDSDHMIHTDAKNNKTWREGGYVLAQVQDAGPFQGSWYVQSQTLRVDRIERMNSELLSGGAIYQLNQSKSNLPDLLALIEQTRAHEAAHSALVREKLLELGHDGDPAVRIEKLVGPGGEDAFQFLVDFNVRDVESVLYEATSDDQVKGRLRSEGFAREVSLWVPTRPETGTFLKKLGPLWGIGH